MVKKFNTRQIKYVVNVAGGYAALARALGITPQSIIKWKQIPGDRVLKIEELTRISRHELRPDIFGEKVAKPSADEAIG